MVLHLSSWNLKQNHLLFDLHLFSSFVNDESHLCYVKSWNLWHFCLFKKIVLFENYSNVAINLIPIDLVVKLFLPLLISQAQIFYFPSYMVYIKFLGELVVLVFELVLTNFLRHLDSCYLFDILNVDKHQFIFLILWHENNSLPLIKFYCCLLWI